MSAVDRVERQRGAASLAASLWQSSPAAGAHAYLSEHEIEAHGLRQRGGRLVVPMRDASGELWNLQFIGPGGGRPKMLHGGRVFGLFHLIGSPGDRLHIAEDYATAARIFAHTGEPTAVAFALHNLRPVALSLREAFPAAKLTIWLPDRRAPAGGPPSAAFDAAAAAAAAVGGCVASRWGCWP